MVNLSGIFKRFEFIIKISIFALTFYYTLDYIFVCEVSNISGVIILILILIIITLLHYFFGRKHQTICPACNK
jgi:hypothetical protein